MKTAFGLLPFNLTEQPDGDNLRPRDVVPNMVIYPLVGKAN
jgi:hypothetical protein